MLQQRLSKRLKAIFQLVDPGNAEVHDLCCDHGDLGIRVAQEELAQRIILLDRVPSIIENLTIRLKTTDIPSHIKILALCEDATKNQRNLKNSTAIIAGVGESTAISIVDKIVFDSQSSLILAVHSENFHLRKQLIKRGLKLVKEEVVEDKGKYYELIKVSMTAPKEIGPIGDEMWSAHNPASLGLLNKRIGYLEKKLSHEKDEEYEDFLKRLKLKLENLT